MIQNHPKQRISTTDESASLHRNNDQSVGGALIAGVWSAGVYVGVDLVAGHARIPAATTAQMVLGATALLGVVTGFCLFAAEWGVRSTRWYRGGDSITAIGCGLCVQIVLICVLDGFRLLVTVPIPWLSALLMGRLLNRQDHVGRRLLTAVMIWLAVSIMVTVLVALPLRCSATGLALGLPIILAALALLLRLAIPVAPWVCVGCLILNGLIFLTGTHSPDWKKGRDVQNSPEATLNQLAASGLPNVVLVVLDTTRKDHLSCYGSTRTTTPNADALAAEGVLYLQAVSPAPWTVPSHASLFTGLFPVTHGCDNVPHRWLDDGFETMAEMLSSAGYQTVAVVANEYLLASNLLQGFDEYLKLDLESAHRGTRTYRLMMKAGGPSRYSDQGAADGVAAVTDWITHRRDRSRPFFLFVNLMEAHWPLFPPYSARVQHLPAGTGYWEATRVSDRFFGVHWLAGQRHTPEEANAIRGLYAAEVEYQDSRLGALVRAIGQEVSLDDALLIVTADHGENLGEGGRWDHVFAVNDALIHVPLIIRYPALFPAGSRIDGQCQLTDVLPTVLDVTGMTERVPVLPGGSLVPVRFQPRAYTYAQMHPYYGHFERMESMTGFARDTAGFLDHQRTVRSGSHKYVWSSLGRHALYDLLADPGEEVNLIDKHPGMAETLHHELERWWAAQPVYVPRPGERSQPLDEDLLRGLRGLGYVGD